jgi:pilus assembly protein CpaC
MTQHRRPLQSVARIIVTIAPAVFCAIAAAQTNAPNANRGAQASASATAATSYRNLPCRSLKTGDTITAALGKSHVVQLPSPANALFNGGGRGSSMGGVEEPQQSGAPSAQRGAAPAGAAGGAPRAPGGGQGSLGVADTEIMLLSPTELLVLGRRPGSANVIVQDRDGNCVVRDIVVTIDPQTLQSKLSELMPDERDIRVSGAEDAIVLSGSVADLMKVEQVMALASSYGTDKKVVNLLRVNAPQQVMLEVKIAEVSKGLLDRFGLDYGRIASSGNHTNVFSGIIGGAPGVFGRFGPNIDPALVTGSAAVGIGSDLAATAGSTNTLSRAASVFGIDAENRDGIVRVLAEPNIMAISGQPASFLSGGKIFIPVAQERSAGGTTITLEEKEFGVGLKFTPTVLDGRINLKVTSEVSELAQSGTPFATVGGVTAVLPSMTTRRVDTTVQLGDGQSFAVAGLIRNNVTEALSKFPGLGEAPVLGALFRSTEFQNDRTELMFVVTPRLVKPTPTPITLPTDHHTIPTRGAVILQGAGEGPMPHAVPASTPAPASPALAPVPALGERPGDAMAP